MKLITKHLNTAITKAKQDENTELVTILEDVKQYAQDHYQECNTRKALGNLLIMHIYNQTLEPTTIAREFKTVYGITVNPADLPEPKYSLYQGLTAVSMIHDIMLNLSFFWEDKPNS